MTFKEVAQLACVTASLRHRSSRPCATPCFEQSCPHAVRHRTAVRGCEWQKTVRRPPGDTTSRKTLAAPCSPHNRRSARACQTARALGADASVAASFVKPCAQDDGGADETARGSGSSRPPSWSASMVPARWMRLCCGHRRALLRSLFARIIYGVCCARSRPVCVVINTLYVLRCACPCLMAFLGHSGPILRVLVRDISICNRLRLLHPGGSAHVLCRHGEKLADLWVIFKTCTPPDGARKTRPDSSSDQPHA